MTTGQNDPAAVNFGGGFVRLTEGWEAGLLEKGAAAGWTPVRFCP
jgi:hypothetical protein